MVIVILTHHYQKIKWDNEVDMMADDLIAYADNLRAIRNSSEHACAITRKAASMLERLGIQDTTRKRRTNNGPWVGGIYDTSNK